MTQDGCSQAKLSLCRDIIAETVKTTREHEKFYIDSLSHSEKNECVSKGKSPELSRKSRDLKVFC
jgi:hypothetical protein